jgi:phage-related protein
MEERKPLFWIRSSRRDLKEFPEDVLDVVGRALDEAQRGRKPHEAKPLKGFGGAGVLEIVDDHEGNTYRAVYTVRFPRAVYVLHCFQKKSKKGIATPKADLDLIKSRLADAEKEYEKWVEENDEEA